VLTIGRKGPKGNPTDTDRFFFVSPFEANGIRQPLPAFQAFNEAAVERRQVIRGMLAHADIPDAFQFGLKAHVLPSQVPPPSRRPACTGDGNKATRYGGLDAKGAEIWREIPCPGRLCEFRQGSPAACKASGRLYFRPVWAPPFAHLPTPLVKWANNSWNTTSFLLGFFDHVREQAAGLGVAEWSIYGLIFELTLGMKSQPKRQRAFPVVSMTPVSDLLQGLLRQREELAALGSGASPRLKLVAGARAPEENTAAVVAADHRAITPGVPGNLPPAGDTVDVEPVPHKNELLDNIRAELAKRHPGDSKAAADARKAAMGSAFGVPSWKAVEGLTVDRLDAGLKTLMGPAQTEHVTLFDLPEREPGEDDEPTDDDLFAAEKAREMAAAAGGR
jgi:hypothetical protein